MSPTQQRTGPAVLNRYLLEGEKVVAAIHQHWAKIAEPVLSAVGGAFLVLWLDAQLGAQAPSLANLLWWGWFFLVLRMLWKLIEWRHDWFIATDKRLLLTYGLVTQKVAMMPLSKVTDMSYNRSPMGRLLGYGTFVMESAGQDQALHNVTLVPHPDQTYRAICAEIFGADDGDRAGGEETSEDFAADFYDHDDLHDDPYGDPYGDPREGRAGGSAPRGGSYHGPVPGSGLDASGNEPPRPRRPARDGRRQDRRDDRGDDRRQGPGDDDHDDTDGWSTAIPLAAPADDPDARPSADLRPPYLRDADTGPIPIFRPHPRT